jgi:DNA-binding NtrC family response regulator
MEKYKILIVDDEPDTLELYSKFLECNEYEIATAQSSEDAVQLLKTQEWDLLISDIFMPKIDGFEVIGTAQNSQKNIKTIAVTGYGTEKVLAKVLENDCYGYINKPFDWDYLKLLIKKALGITKSSTKFRKP